MWYLGVLKYVKLGMEREIYLRRNILIREYFVQDDSFSADRRVRFSLQNCKYRSHLQHQTKDFFQKYMCNVFDKLICDCLDNWCYDMLCDYLLDCLKVCMLYCYEYVAMWHDVSVHDYLYYVQWICMSDHYHCHELQDSSCMYEYHCLIGLNKIMH